jgi:hypothetical protein
MNTRIEQLLSHNRKNYAPVGSYGVLHHLWMHNALGDYLLLLAHDVLAAPDKWHDLIQLAQPRFVIMDNSLIELGRPLPSGEVIQAAKIVNADVIVVPDQLLNAHATVRLAAEALRNGAHNYSRLCVVQGETYREVMDCARELVAMCQPDVLAIPKAVEDRVVPRMFVANELWATYNIPIHLLGFSEYPDQDMLALSCDGVIGIDSAMPIWLGKSIFPRDAHLPESPPRGPTTEFGSRPRGYLDWDRAPAVAFSNIERVREWIEAFN